MTQAPAAADLVGDIMHRFAELIILLPCHSLEDFPMDHRGDEAEGLLSAWSALWHPHLIHSSGKLPSWHRADEPPEDLTGRLLIIPAVSESLVLAGWPARAESESATVVRQMTDRREIIEAALAPLDAAAVDEDLVADFLALGYCYLQVELLTRQMRYMSSVDDVHFTNEVVAAATAACQHEGETAREHLRSCFDVLMEARERFYPVEAYLIDLTLLADTTLGQSLLRELDDQTPKNIVAAASLIGRLANRDPATLERMRAAVAAGRISIAGGERNEGPLGLLPPEHVLRELLHGRISYEKHLGEQPTVFARRRCGLSPALPQLLCRCGFKAALHFTLDQGRFPKAEQSKTRWEGMDGSAIDALARVPLDAARPETFLSFAERMGETMDLDHVAAVVFAHWPGDASHWYEDLRRVARFGSVLGRFVTLGEFFAETDSPGQVSRFAADQYRSPYLVQAVERQQAGPISAVASLYRREQLLSAAQTLETLASLLSRRETSAAANLQSLADESDAVCDHLESGAELEGRLQESLDASAQRLALALPKAESDGKNGCLVVNPLGFSRRVGIELPRGCTPPSGDLVRQVQVDGHRRSVVVDLPPMGYLWLCGEETPPTTEADSNPPLAEGKTLRNEFCEVVVHRKTGGIAAIYDYHSRGNRISQQLALRSPGPKLQPGEPWRDPDQLAVYTDMVAESIDVTSTGPAYGEIVSRGKLVDGQGRSTASFVQTMRLWRGSRLLLLDLELETDRPPHGPPWESYYAARFAWGDAGANIERSLAMASVDAHAKRIEAPQFVVVSSGDARTTILSGGMPYHRRTGFRGLDTLLIVSGEEARSFRLGIGVDLPHPVRSALELLSPPIVVPHSGPPPAPASAWLFHVGARNLLATHIEPRLADGRVTGFAARLLETAGRRGRTTLRCLRNVTTARQTDFLGRTLAQLPVSRDEITVDFTAHEWLLVEAAWEEDAAAGE